ncbi:MAG: hypothetical protein ABH854_05405 [Candidatus Diapherotrites archaeon]|nr:hypothetical protein [Candidatus Micrarchaeota archaeon]MBU1939434.1 hypothetical protein [Candidatus Micrarchaeota archaeon]
MVTQELILEAKKNCRLCCGRRLLRDSDDEKQNVQSVLQELYGHYLSQYDALRRADASSTDIKKAYSNKTLALDMLHDCKRCNREVDSVNRAVGGLGK